jgi:hypothetical protein
LAVGKSTDTGSHGSKLAIEGKDWVCLDANKKNKEEQVDKYPFLRTGHV